MAKQKGIIKLEGTIGGVTFYKSKDGFVQWVCVYAVVFWMPLFPEAILHVYFIFLNGLWQWNDFTEAALG
jgi:hypothetical protein